MNEFKIIQKKDNKYYPLKKCSFLGIHFWRHQTQCQGMMDIIRSFEKKEDADKYIGYFKNNPCTEDISDLPLWIFLIIMTGMVVIAIYSHFNCN